MRYFLVAALLAQYGLPSAKTQPPASSRGAGTTGQTPASLVPFVFLAMLIWLRIAIRPPGSLYRTRIPF
jgi:hypothetical protein